MMQRVCLLQATTKRERETQKVEQLYKYIYFINYNIIVRNDDDDDEATRCQIEIEFVSVAFNFSSLFYYVQNMLQQA